MPLAATRRDAAGAKAFAEFFIRTIDWGYATTSGAYIRHFAEAACIGCLSFANGMDADRRRHYTLHGGRLSVRQVELSRQHPHAPLLLVSFDQEAYEKWNPHGALVDSDLGRRAERFEVDLVWAGSWRVERLAVVTP